MAQGYVLSYPLFEKDQSKDLLPHLKMEFKGEPASTKDSKYRQTKTYSEKDCPKYLNEVVDRVMTIAQRDTKKYNVILSCHHRKSIARHNIESKDLKYRTLVALPHSEVYKCEDGERSVYFLSNSNLLIVAAPCNNKVEISVQDKTIFRFDGKTYCRPANYSRYTVIVDLY